MSSQQLIQGCQRFERSSQRQLFEEFYSLIMGIALRYSKNSSQAKEMLTHCFLEICTEINEIKKDQNIEEWLKEKMIKKAVYFLRSKRQEYFITSTVHLLDENKKSTTDLFNQEFEPDANSMSATQYLEAIQLLPPSFRAVYNLIVIDQIQLDEVAGLLEISVETCRYNLNKSKEVLYKNIQHLQKAA